MKRLENFGRETFELIKKGMMDDPYWPILIAALICAVIMAIGSNEMSDAEYAKCTELAQVAYENPVVEVPKGYSLKRMGETIITYRYDMFYHGVVYAYMQKEKLVIKRGFSYLTVFKHALQIASITAFVTTLILLAFFIFSFLFWKATEKLSRLVSRREERLT